MADARWKFVTGLAILVVPSLAEAQAVPRGETARGSTVATRAREDFDPPGVRLGAFRANAAAELGLGYDDNILGSRRNRRSDGYGSWLAEGSVVSDWSRHAVGINARVEERRYLDESDFDWTDYSVSAFGRYDLNADTAFELRLNRAQEHLEPSSIDVQEAGVARPVPYQFTEIQAQGSTRLNRIGVLALVNWRDYTFDDVDAGGPPVPGAPDPGRVSRFDFESWIGALGLTYELAPGRFINLIGRFQDIRYQEAAERRRDSKTWEVLAGFTYDFDGIWQARVAAGFRQRDYEGPGIPSLSGPAFEGNVTWQPTLLTTVTFTGRRSIEESIRDNAVSFTRTAGEVGVDHEYLRNVILGARLGVDRRDYDSPDEQATDGYAVLSARWLINRNLSLVGSYQHARRLDNSATVEEFDRNLFQLRLRIAL